jgi:hypothetical protein
MTALQWDKVGERVYEAGVDHGVLYQVGSGGEYGDGVAWNGLVTVTESPSGAESSAQYADNIKYLNLVSAEEFGGTIEAFTYPEEFAQNDGSASPEAGVTLGQQGRRVFGMVYRTRVGNDVDGTDHGYKLHLVYGAQASPSEKAYGTINDSPEAITFSWEFSTTPVPVGEIDGVEYKPTSTITVDSTKVDADALEALEEQLFGTAGTDPLLPNPATVIALFAGTVTEVTPATPTYNSTTDIITIPSTTGVVYSVDGEDVPAGAFGPITESKVVHARPAAGYSFADGADDDWSITFA